MDSPLGCIFAAAVHGRIPHDHRNARPAIAPGTYTLRRQREQGDRAQADEERFVAD
jgi:hypothetical protein